MTNSINTNISAFYAQANITSASILASSSVARLSSGNRIVQASDDVAGLATGASLLTQVSALKTAQTNASQGTSLLQVADGALAQIQSILQQQQSLALQAGSGSLTDTDRGFLNQQFQALSNEIDSLAASTTFNGVNLIDGSIATGGSNNPLRSLSDPITGGGAGSLATVTGFTNQSHFDTTTPIAMVKTTGSGTLGDTAFVGDLSKGIWTVTDDGTGKFAITYTINGKSYTAAGVDPTGVTGSKVDLINIEDTAGNSSAGMIELTFDATDIHDVYTADAAGALKLQNALKAETGSATAYAVRKVDTVLAKDADGHTIAGSAIQTTDTNGTLLDGFSGSKVTLSSAIYDGTDSNLPPIAHFSATGVGTNVVFSVLVNGVTYSTEGTVVENNGGQVNTSTFGGHGAGVLQFFKNGDKNSDNTKNEYLKLDLSAISVAAKVHTSEEVSAFTDALNTVFGSGGAAGGLTFQLGTTSASDVAVNIASAKTSALFAGASLDISTQGGAASASTAVTTALETITSIRAGVGALESQFGFASAALQTSVQNQTAAASQFLDTDIAAESTSFATQQVKLQAGISVLAQANQQLQALLKLIG